VALNDSLLLALCRQQGGTFHSLNPGDDIEKAVARLGQTLGQPILLDLRLPEGWESADAVIPNLYAGQIHYLSARSCNGTGNWQVLELELAARTATSQPVQIQFERQTANAEAPYLHWCKSRIQRLVAEGNSSAAIALSVESNLICRLTAFVAWDESEKVTVATHELVQPAMLTQVCGLVGPGTYHSSKITATKRMAARSAPDQAPASAGMLFGALDVDNRAAAAPLHPVPPDEVRLRRELSDICHRIGIADWEPLVKAILDWIAGARLAKRLLRITQAKSLLRRIKRHADRFSTLQASEKRTELDTVRNEIQQLLKAFVDKLPAAK